MALHGLKGRADDWAQGLEAGEKDTFAHLKASIELCRCIYALGDISMVCNKS